MELTGKYHTFGEVPDAEESRQFWFENTEVKAQNKCRGISVWKIPDKNGVLGLLDDKSTHSFYLPNFSECSSHVSKHVCNRDRIFQNFRGYIKQVCSGKKSNMLVLIKYLS